jgi:hypothetical protein
LEEVELQWELLDLQKKKKKIKKFSFVEKKKKIPVINQFQVDLLFLK